MLGIIAHVIGLLGMLLVVFAFHKTVEGSWDGKGETFNVVNLCGAVLLLLSLLVHFNLGSFVIEIFWILISLRGLYRLHKRGHTFTSHYTLWYWIRTTLDRVGSNYANILKGR